MKQEQSPIKCSEKAVDTTQYDLENINRAGEDTEMSDEEIDMENMDGAILANLNIMKGQMQQLPGGFVVNHHSKPPPSAHKMTKLPQTQEELEELSIDSADYQIKD